MPECRFFIDSPLIKDQEVFLHDEEMRHLIVMRPEIHDTIEIINGKGALAQARITQFNKREITAEITSLHHEPEDSIKLIIAQGMPKLPRLDIILEKGTELGMTELWLFPADRSEKVGLSANQHERIRKILIASMKQCGRLYIPKVQVIDPIASWKDLSYPLFYGAFGENTPSFASALKQTPPKDGILFVVGPESGLSAKEEKQLNKLNAQGVSLHKNILRTDTAPLAALTLMSQFLQ
jgi:16S rRNA (uracil1498-N3)-methyltransferase